MEYSSNIRRGLIGFFRFFSVAVWFLYIYFKLWDFVKAAIALQYVNVQTVCFSLYSVLIVLIPAAILYLPKFSKRKLFMAISFAIALTLFIGATGDLFTYSFFIDYEFMEGDAIFCNIILSIPNIYGVLLCYLLAGLYVLFGINIIDHRYRTFFIYLFIFIIGYAPAYIYSYLAWGGYPRQTWIEKAAFLIPHQLSMLICFALSFTSQFLWEERIR